MNRKPLKPDESWEDDAVWKLLDQATPTTPSPRFTDNCVRAARLSTQPEPWWKRLFSPAPLAGLAATCAALAITIASLPQPAATTIHQTAAFDSKQAATIQEIAETETLIAAVDHIEDFSDHELITMIGF